MNALLRGLLAALAVTGCATSFVTRAGPPPAAIAERQLVVTVVNPPVPPAHGAGSTRRTPGWSVGYGVSPQAQRAVEALAREYRLRAVDAWPIALLGVHCVVFEAAPGVSRRPLRRALAADPRVESVQAMQIFGTVAASTREARYATLQHAAAALQLEQAHRWALGRGVRVAVIDTGVDLAHPEFAGRIVAHADFTGDDAQAFSDDRHGTAVAGVIASGDGGRLIGVAPAAELLALKACRPAAPDAIEARCTSFTLARALALAVERGADVVNLSLSGPEDALLSRILDQALARGIAIVGAVRPDAGKATFPVSTDGVLAVRSTGDAVTGDAVLAAPGEDILTTAPQGRYDFQSGSSLAAAQVSGVIALLLEHRARLSPGQLSRLLAAGSTNGSVNACAALGALLGHGECAAATEIAGVSAGTGE